MEDGKRCRKHQNTTKVSKKLGKSKTHHQDEQRKDGSHLKGRIENYDALKHCLIDRDEGDGESVPDSPSEEIESVSEKDRTKTKFNVSIELDVMAVILFVCGVATRMYRLEEPRSIVFDELHYGKYVSLYMKRIFSLMLIHHLENSLSLLQRIWLVLMETLSLIVLDENMKILCLYLH